MRIRFRYLRFLRCAVRRLSSLVEETGEYAVGGVAIAL